MKTDAFRTLAVWLGSLCFICLLAQPRVRAESGVKFELIQNHWIVVPVFVSGKGRFDFLLDTGANVTMITPELAVRLAIHPTARVTLLTAAGTQVVPYSLLPSLSLGSRTVEKLDAVYNALSEIRSLNPRISGVLGQNFLSQFNYTLNYQHRMIEFVEDHKNLPLGSRLQCEQREGRLIVVARSASSKKKRLRLVLDSGVSRLIIFENASQPLELDLEHNENQWSTASTPAGSRRMRTAYLRTLQLGDATFSNLPVALVEAPGTKDHFGDGLLPTSLFRSVFFNNKEGYVILNGGTSQ